jgi:hypothetical protein
MDEPAPSAEIIHIKSRKPLEQHLIDEDERINADIAVEDEMAIADRDRCADLLDSARSLVESGRLTGLIVIGLDPMTDHFFNEIRMDGPAIERQTMFAYIGILDTIKMELMEAAMMAPVMNTDGAIVDPFAEMPVFDEDDGDFE